MTPRHFLSPAKVWISCAAFFTAAGWILSAAHRLDSAGYAGVVASGIALLILACHGASPAFSLSKLTRRYRRVLPALFLVFAVLATIGGILYTPNNYDGLTYRFPRILHWFANHRWHWIETHETRMNYSATGFEWLMAPFFALTGSDRLFFLVNIVSFLLLPGLTYATLIRLGISKRVAWYWMWLLPSGYCFVTQAGSIGNDAFAAVFLLSSLCFTLRARESGRASDLWYGMIAAALLTGAKASNAPLLLPWALALLPSVGLLKTKLVPTVLIALLCSVVSFLPIACLNVKHAGGWTGDPTNHDKLTIEDPAFGLAGNALQLVARNAMPPVMPFAGMWNQSIRRLLDKAPLQILVRHFPRFALTWNELEQEEAAGLGLGLSTLLIVTLFAGMRRPASKPRMSAAFSRSDLGMLICLGGWIALAVYMAKMGSEAGPRLVAAYYPLLIASLLLLPGVAELVRARWWKNLALLAAFSALPVIVLTPSRPLWPAMTVCEILARDFPDNRLIHRAESVYSVYRDRADGLAPLREGIRPEEKVVGFVGADDSEVALWRPFGARRVVDVSTSNQFKIGNELSIVLASDDSVRSVFKQTMDQWLAAIHGRVIGSKKLLTKAAGKPRDWFVIELDSKDRSQGLPRLGTAQ